MLSLRKATSRVETTSTSSLISRFARHPVKNIPDVVEHNPAKRQLMDFHRMDPLYLESRNTL